MPKLILLTSLALSWWLIRRDIAKREGLSSAIWIPTIWIAITASRPVSMWLGFGGGTSTMEGSPIDALIFFILIGAAFAVLSRRALNWTEVISENWPIFLFYAFLLVSVLWANSPFVSFKRWFKEFGNIAVLLVILTDPRPQQALRAVFVRCAYLLLPLSLVFIRYFPSLGRFYSSHGGGEFTGVTTQKNSLGMLVVVCGLVLLWDWIEVRKEPRARKTVRRDRCIIIAMLFLSAYLMHMSHSATSLVCLVFGTAIVGSRSLLFFRRRPYLLGVAALSVIVGYWVFDQVAGGLTRDAVATLGRDMTFTGRTDVWRELLALHTDPLLGVGYMSLWDDPNILSRLPEWMGSSAHNGYLEDYLAGGWVRICFLTIMLVAAWFRINGSLTRDADYGAFRLAILYVFLMVNFSESSIACMTPIGFLFLLTAIGHVWPDDDTEMLPESYSATEWQASETEPERTFAPTYDS